MNKDELDAARIGLRERGDAESEREAVEAVVEYVYTRAVDAVHLPLDAVSKADLALLDRLDNTTHDSVVQRVVRGELDPDDAVAELTESLRVWAAGVERQDPEEPKGPPRGEIRDRIIARL